MTNKQAPAPNSEVLSGSPHSPDIIPADLQVAIPHRNPELTRAALRYVGSLASGLNLRLRLIDVHVVPYGVPLDEPTVRELALRQAAHEVEVRQEEQRPTERILVHMTGDPSTAMLIRRGRRMADYLRAECFAVYISTTGDLSNLPPAERESVERHLNFARNLHLETRTLQGQNRASTLVDFARRHQIRQIFLTRPRSRRWKQLPNRSLISQVLRLAQDIQVTVVADRKKR